MILARNDLIEERPEIVKAFVEASIIGWRKYIYEDPEAGNNLILNENSEMTEEILFQAIDKIKKYNLISNSNDYNDVGLMTEERWNEFYITMSNNGIYKKDLNWKDSYSLQFISEGE